MTSPLPQDQIREALEAIRGGHCASFTSGLGSCYRNGRTEGSQYLSARVCDPCRADKALALLAVPEPMETPVERVSFHDKEYVRSRDYDALEKRLRAALSASAGVVSWSSVEPEELSESLVYAIDCKKRTKAGKPMLDGDLHCISLAAALCHQKRPTPPPPREYTAETIKELVAFLAYNQTLLDEARNKMLAMNPEEVADAIVMKWPMIQGLRNQMNIRALGKLPWTSEGVAAAIKALLLQPPAKPQGETNGRA